MRLTQITGTDETVASIKILSEFPTIEREPLHKAIRVLNAIYQFEFVKLEFHFRTVLIKLSFFLPPTKVVKVPTYTKTTEFLLLYRLPSQANDVFLGVPQRQCVAFTQSVAHQRPVQPKYQRWHLLKSTICHLSSPIDDANG